MKYFLASTALAFICSSCGTLNKIPESQLEDDHYRFRQPGERYTKVYVDVSDDSVSIIPADKNAGSIKPIKSATDELFLKRRMDIDILIVPFKYRPSSYDFPRQLTTEFNGNVFFGYRLDRFRVHYTKTPTGIVKQIRHRALTAGAFGGLGSTSITPWTTNYQTTDEYNGLILSRGLSLMFGVNNLTVGFGVGWDYLTDRDKNIWIYQNKAWYGMTLSININ